LWWVGAGSTTSNPKEEKPKTKFSTSLHVMMIGRERCVLFLAKCERM
jgi:hypothetical protein